MGNLGYDPENIVNFVVNMVERNHGSTRRTIVFAIENAFPDLGKDFITGLLEDMSTRGKVRVIRYECPSDRFKEIHYYYLPKGTKIAPESHLP